MSRMKISLLILMGLIPIFTVMGQHQPARHEHKDGENCLRCNATEVNEIAAQREAVYLKSRVVPKRVARMMKSVQPSTLPEDFEYVIPIVFHVFGTEFNAGTKVSLDLIRAALEETNKDFKGLQDDWQKLHPARDSIKKALNITFRLAEKDPNGKPTTGVTFHDWNAGFGNGSGMDSEIQKYAWDNYQYMNVYIMQDLYDDGMTNNSGVAWYPLTWMSDDNLARVVYNGSYIGTNTDSEFRSVLSHEFGHFFNLKHTFEGCDDGYNYPNDEIDDTPVHLYDLTLQEGQKNPFGEVIDVCNFMNYPRMYKNFTRQQVARMKAALEHEARVTLWQEENHKKVFYMEATPRLEVAEGTILEGVKNDGSFDAAYRISMLDAKFKMAIGEYLPENDYTVTNLPQGLTVKVKVKDAKNLAIELAGNAAAHAIANKATFTMQLKNTLLQDGVILNPEFKLNITYRDPYQIVYVDESDININPSANWKFFYLGAGDADFGAWYSNNADMTDEYKLQSYKKPLVATPGTHNIIPLELGTVIGDDSEWVTPKDEYLDVLNFKTPEYLDWVGKNAYVGVQFTINGEKVYGWLNVTFNASGSGYTVHDWAYNTEPNASIKAGETADGIAEKIQVSPGELAEDVANDGSFTENISIKILGVSSEFTKTGDLVAGTDYTITGIPAGLTVKISLEDKSNGSIVFDGKATSHGLADSADIKIELNKSLVNNETIKGLSSQIRLRFKAPYGIFYNNIPDIWVASNGVWTEFGFDIGDAVYELWYATNLGNKFKFVSAANPVVAYKGTPNIVPLKFGELVGDTLTETMAWEIQKSGVPQAEIDESMLDIKTDTYLEWVGKSAYIGVQFKNNGLVHYGWIGVRFEADGNMLTMEDWAYNEEPGKPIPAGYTQMDQKPFLVWPSKLLKETVSNDGKLDSSLIKVKGTTLAVAKNEKLVAGTHYESTELPTGLKLEMVVQDEQTVKMLITGNAVSHNAADSVDGWSVTLKNEAFTLPISGNENKFNIRFRDAYKIVYVDVNDTICNANNNWITFKIAGQSYGLWLNEGCLRLETSQKDIICVNESGNPALVKPLPKGFLIQKDATWNAGGEFPDEHWIWSPTFVEWEGRDAYIGTAFWIEEDYQYAWLHISVASDGSSYTLLDYAYCEGPGTPIRAGDKGIAEAPFFLVPEKTFYENIDNTGVVSDTLHIDLVNGEMKNASGVLTSEEFTVIGLSEGLTIKLEQVSNSQIRATLSGTAKQHALANSVKNIELTLNNSLFTESTVLKSNKIELAVSFRDPYKVIFEDFIDFECSRYNTWTLLDIDGVNYGIWYDIDGGLILRLETYGAPVVCDGTSRNITPVKRGEMIGASSNWVDGADWPDEHNIYTPSYTAWKGLEAYIGLKYEVEGRTRYGWIRIEVSEDGQSFVVKDLAYNQVFGEPIVAGVKENQELIVSFAADRELLYESQQVKFSNNTFSIKEVVEYKWVFEGGTPATFEGKEPEKITYNQAGKYAVSLEVKTADTTVTYLKKEYVKVEPIMIKADFTMSGLGVLEGKSVTFTDASVASYEIVKWEWSFEGGTPATFEGQNPGEVIYASAGNYEVTLKVTDEDGRMHTKFASPGITVYEADYKSYCPVKVECPTENSYCYIANVIVGESENVTKFGGYTDYSRDIQFSLTKGQKYPFVVELNNEQEAGVSAWIDWNGNGVYEDTEQVAGYIDNYDKPQDLALQVPEDAVSGLTGMRIRVKIGDQIQPPCIDEGYYGEVEDYAVLIASPVVNGDIMADKQNIRCGDIVQFTADVNKITDKGIVAYKWTFAGAVNPGSTERIPAPVQYATEGIFDVALELTLQGGETQTVTKKNFIIVNQAITKADFTASVTDIVAGEEVQYTDNSESASGIKSWVWSFEGGNPATFTGQTPPKVAYVNAGSYEVSLTITDNNNNQNVRIESMMIEVYGKHSGCAIEESERLDAYYSITDVRVGDKTNSTGRPHTVQVNDFTNIAFTLERGVPQPLEVTLSMSRDPWVMVWVDWNQDGTFDEATETVANYQEKDKPADLTITAPEDAAEGSTMMRVRTNFYNALTPCADMSNMGEVEDYSIIIKKARPDGYIIADNTNPAIGAQVQFTAFVNRMTEENITAYKWTFVGGTPASAATRNPGKVTYAANGVYDVTLELTLESGKTKAITMYDFITVGDKAPEITLDVQASSVDMIAGESTTFSAVTGGTVTDYQWTFVGGNPASSTSATPTVVYAAPGVYDVMLIATLNNGETRNVTKSNYIVVNENVLKADFTVVSKKVSSGKDILFTNISLGASSYSWDFGDGTAVSTDKNPTHAFADAGSYTVKLTAIQGSEESHTKEMVITVSALKVADCMPTGNFTDYCRLLSVQFGDVVNDVERTEYYNDYTSGTPFVMAPEQEISYTIQAANPGWPVGIYVWVDWDNSGSFSDDTERVLAFRADEVDDPATGTIQVPSGLSDGLVRMRVATDYYNNDIAGNPLLACGGAMAVEEYAVQIGSVGSGEAQELFILSDTTVILENQFVSYRVDGAESDATYAWTFAGGSPATSEEATPNVQYTTPGLYDVSVTVNSGGVEKTITESRFVWVKLSQISADFKADKTVCAVGEKVAFTSLSTATAAIASQQWTFANATPATSTEANPVVVFTTAGQHDVTLEIVDEFGKTDTKTVTGMIDASVKVKADFTVEKTNVAVNEILQFTDASIAAVSYEWTFDGGEPATSTEKNPTVKLQVPGISMATLIVRDVNGKRDVKSIAISVSPQKFGAIQVEQLVQVYDGQTKAIDVTTVPASLLADTKITYTQNNVEVVPQNAGLYDVKVSYVGTIPYSVPEVSTTLEITKAKVNVLASQMRQAYDGTSKTPVLTTRPAGFEQFIVANYVLDEESVDTLINAGEYKLSAQVVGENYEGELLEDVFVIKKKIGSISIVLQSGYTYDGEEKTVKTVTTVPVGMDYHITYNGQDQAPINAGVYLAAADINDVNYEGRAEASMIVKRTGVEMHFQQTRFEYDGQPHEVTVEIAPGEIPYRLTYLKERKIVEQMVNVGVYQAKVDVFHDNHEASVLQTIYIERAQAAIRISNLKTVADGQPKEVTVETTPAGLPVEVTYNGFSQLPYVAGEYTVLVEVVDTNYKGYKSAVMNIVPQESDLKIMNLVIVDGTKDCIFRVPELEGLNKTLIIFDSRGGQVYESKEYYDDYDMRNLPAGTYYYILTYVEDGQKKSIKRFVEVVRK